MSWPFGWESVALSVCTVTALVAGCSMQSQAAPAQTPSAAPYQRLSGIPMDRALAYTKVQYRPVPYVLEFATSR